MGRKHTKDEILDGAVAAAVADGLSNLTFGRLAKRLAIADRTIVYYFPTKSDLIAEVVIALGVRLQETLAGAFSTPATDHLGLARAAWPVLARAEADPIFALFFEANGLAAAGQQPYDSLAPQIIESWIVWMTEFLAGPPEERRSEAEAALAVIDGLLLLRQLGGAATADRAARRLGVLPPPPRRSRAVNALRGTSR
jgi:AcrR family transcriptional regulator